MVTRTCYLCYIYCINHIQPILDACRYPRLQQTTARILMHALHPLLKPSLMQLPARSHRLTLPPRPSTPAGCHHSSVVTEHASYPTANFPHLAFHFTPSIQLPFIRLINSYGHHDAAAVGLALLCGAVASEYRGREADMKDTISALHSLSNRA